MCTFHVFFPVPRQTELDPEPQPTNVALVGPLAGVNSLMGYERTAVPERLSAHVAPVSPFPRVNSLVNLQVRALRKHLSADAALEGLLARVRPFV